MSTPFRNRPREEQGESEISLILGRVSVQRAAELVLMDDARPDDRVRYGKVGLLLEHGFDVWRSPNRRNPDHVSVALDGDWDDDACARFDSCFEEAAEEEEEEVEKGEEYD